MAGGISRRFGSVGCACLSKDAGNVVVYGPDADDQIFGDLPVVPT